MQNHGNAAPAGRQDRGGGDVAASAEHHIDRIPADRSPHADAGQQQTQQLEQLGEPAPLQAAGVHANQTKAFWHQTRFEPIRNPQPAHGPLIFHSSATAKAGKRWPPVPLAAIRSRVIASAVSGHQA